MFGLYGNHYEDREEFHLLSMFEVCCVRVQYPTPPLDNFVYVTATME